jgi:hypothetical protein
MKIIVGMLFLSFVGIVACENTVSDTENQNLSLEERSKSFIADLSESAISEMSIDKIALEDTEIANKAHQYLFDVGFTGAELDQILFDHENDRSLKEVDAAITWLALTVAISEIPELNKPDSNKKGKVGEDAYTKDWPVYNCLFQAVGMNLGFQIIERNGLSSGVGKTVLMENFSAFISNDLGPLGSVFATMQFSACVSRTIVDSIN